MPKKILVTGGTGYIGSHTVVELQNEGFEVLIIDNLSNSDISVLDNITKITGIRPYFENFNICDEQKIQDFFSSHSLDAVIHFAAFKAVGESVAEPLKYYKNNLFSLINILEAANQNNDSNVVFSSSCTVYGEPDALPVTEESPIKEALSPYGNTKQIAEEILRDFINSQNQIRAIALRYFNPIGAHESALIGELPIGVPNNLIPFITQTAIGIRDCLNVFGNDYNTTDGTCIRDYINVSDLAKAHVVAVRRLMENQNKKPFEIFNLGTGNGSTVLEVINAFEKVSGQKLNYKIVDRRPGDVEKVYAGTKFANEELGWKTKVSLPDTLLSAWNWEKQFRKGYNLFIGFADKNKKK